MDILDIFMEPKIYPDRQRHLDLLMKSVNRRLELGENITLREMYKTLGLETPDGFDETYDLWGWDKNGFRQLYDMHYDMAPSLKID